MGTLKGKVVLVTGASSGIGRSIASLASSNGADLVITGRSREGLEKTSGMLNSTLLSISADLSTEEGVLSLVERLPNLDGVVFCAGEVNYQPIKFIKSEDLDRIFAINFKGPVLLTRELLRTQKIRNGGSLVYISSISSMLGTPATGIYAASKAALTSFMKVTAAEVAKRKVRSNSVSPGVVSTPRTDEAIQSALGDEAGLKNDRYLLGQGKPDDVSGIVIFLLSDASRWITGSDFVVDGGLTLK